MQIPKIKLVPYFQAIQWDDFLPDVVVLFLCLPLAPPALHLLHVKKNPHKIRVFTWNTWHTYWASYQREIKESPMKGGGKGGVRKKLDSVNKDFFL